MATETCGRCGGTGKYSFNMMDRDMCYGCLGTGRILIVPKEQKPKSISRCKSGDMFEFLGVRYRVICRRWIAFMRYETGNFHNQEIVALRLSDNEQVVMKDGVVDKVTKKAVVTPDEWIGQEA